MILSLPLLLTGCAASTQAETTAATEMATEGATEAVETIDEEAVVVIPTEETAPTEYIPMETLTVEGSVYPGEFGEVFLGADAVRSLRNAHTDYAAEQISHVGDALLYVAEKNPRDPKAGIQLFTALLEGDYPYVGHIEIVWDDNAWIVATVGLDGRYYAFDPYANYDWVLNPRNDCFSNADIQVLSDRLAQPCPFLGRNETPTGTYQVFEQ